MRVHVKQTEIPSASFMRGFNFKLSSLNSQDSSKDYINLRNVATLDSARDVFVAICLLKDGQCGPYDSLLAFADEATRCCHLLIPRLAEHPRILLTGIIILKYTQFVVRDIFKFQTYHKRQTSQ